MKRWPIKLLGELCDVEGGNAAPQGDVNYKDGMIPFVRMKDLGRPHFTNNLTETDDKLTEVSATTNRMKFFEPGSILFPRSGSVALNHRAILGIRACIVSHIGVLQNLRPEITPGFLYLYLTTFDMTALSKKTTGVDSIAFADVKKIPVTVPPLAEQERIVKLMDETDELRKMRTQADHRTAELISALFQEMFGDPLGGKHKWPEVRFEEVTRRITYGFTSPMKHLESGIPIITCKNVLDGKIDFENVHYADSDEFEELTAKSKPQKNDILITKDGTIGRLLSLTWTFQFASINRLHWFS